MANTIKNSTILVSKKEAIIYFTLFGVGGAQETNTVLFDSSVVATTAGDADPLTSNILQCYFTVSAASTARAFLNWDATTPVVAIDSSPSADGVDKDFRYIGGLPNQGGSGITGDITLTTTGLAAGDVITIVLHVKRQ